MKERHEVFLIDHARHAQGGVRNLRSIKLAFHKANRVKPGVALMTRRRFGDCVKDDDDLRVVIEFLYTGQPLSVLAECAWPGYIQHQQALIRFAQGATLLLIFKRVALA